MGSSPCGVRGYVTIDGVEAEIGRAAGPIVAPRSVHVAPGLTMPRCEPIGYWWNCGCDIRGSGPFYVWKACGEHTQAAERTYPVRTADATYQGGNALTWIDARTRYGWSTPPGYEEVSAPLRAKAYLVRFSGVSGRA